MSKHAYFNWLEDYLCLLLRVTKQVILMTMITQGDEDLDIGENSALENFIHTFSEWTLMQMAWSFSYQKHKMILLFGKVLVDLPIKVALKQSGENKVVVAVLRV